MDKSQPKFRSKSLDLSEMIDTVSDSELPGIKMISATSTEQLTRAKFYPLESGGHAKIFLAKLSNQEYVIKKGISKDDLTDLKREKEVLLALSDSEHVVNIIPQGIEIFETSQEESGSLLEIAPNQTVMFENSIVLERVNGEQLNSTFQHLEDAFSAGVISVENYLNTLIFLFKDILVGLNEIQQKNFVHGDLKPNNILYDKIAKKAVVIDFGTTVKQGEGFRPGHESYASPEVVAGMIGRQVRASFSDDLWSVGQIFYEVINSLLHNKTSKFLTEFTTKEVNYSDRIAHIVGLMAVYKKYMQGEPLQVPANILRVSTSSEASTSNIHSQTSSIDAPEAASQAGAVRKASDIYTNELINSPIGHAINDYLSFEYFNSQLQPIIQCLEGIFDPKVEDRISVTQALAILDSAYSVNVEEATKNLANLKKSIGLDAERMKKAREKYEIGDKTER